MQEQGFFLATADGKRIYVVQWLPSGANSIKGIVQISHGMAEHCLRYRPLAQYLTDNGYAVYASDHRGHGQSVGIDDVYGHYADQDGWNKVVDDLYRVNREIARLHPEVPITLLGHSMGSFIARAYVFRHPDSIQGLILSATGMRYGLIANIARTIARWDSRRIGARTPSKLMAKLSFGSFNLRFLPARTAFDWLSRDPAQVDLYINDPMCGFDCSAQLWVDLFGGISEFEAQEKHAQQLPAGLPVLGIVGTHDPVSMGGLGIKQVCKLYQKGGLRDVNVKLYEKARHELTNETNRQQVFTDLGNWLNQRFSRHYALPGVGGAFAEAGIRSGENSSQLQPVTALPH
jgi:alpha-beta hydrolase superfamily lysophospholipase